MRRTRLRPLHGSTAALLLSLAACGPGGGWPSAAAPSSAPAADSGYRAPPQLVSLSRASDGTLSLQGRALPSSAVRLATPAGSRVETTADGDGAWSAPLGPVSEPALYGLSEEANGQRVQAEGYIAVMPGAPTVALLRAGAGAQALDSGHPGLHVLAVDLDASGAAVVSGHAGAGQPLRVMVDGEPALEGRAGGDGRFSLILPRPLPAGPHRLQLMTPKDMALAAFEVSPPRPPADGPYRAIQEKGAWRIDWLTPGGGPQTTLLLADTGPAG